MESIKKKNGTTYPPCYVSKRFKKYYGDQHYTLTNLSETFGIKSKVDEIFKQATGKDVVNKTLVTGHFIINKNSKRLL